MDSKLKFWKKVPERWMWAIGLNIFLFSFYEDLAKVDWSRGHHVVRLVKDVAMIALCAWFVYFHKPNAKVENLPRP